jgi:regulatory protein
VPDAYNTALKLLSRRDHFRAELAEKLRQRGFESGEIDAALDRCEDLDLVADERFARRFAELRSGANGWGPRRIEAELRRRGVSRETAERSSRLTREQVDAALSTALRRTEVRAPQGWWRLPERRARMVSSLIARGFEADHAIAAVKRRAESREKNDHAFDDESGNT